MMHAKKAQIRTMTAADTGADSDKLGLEGSPTRVVKIFAPEHKRAGEMLSGSPEETAAKLAEILREHVI